MTRSDSKNQGQKPAAAKSGKEVKQDRRQLILKTTLRVIAEEGVAAVTHRRVASAAGIPLGSTTYHFESRLHLLREAFDYYLDINIAKYRSLSADLAIETIDDLVDFILMMNDRHYAGEPILLAEYELTLFAARDPAIARSLHAWDELSVSSMARHLETLGAAKPFDAARTVVYLVRGYELDRLSYHQGDPKDLRQRMKVVIEAFVT